MTSTADEGPTALTSGPIGRTLILFALPIMGASALQSLNGTANAIWVSQLIGETALAATSNANIVFTLLLGVAAGVSMSANLMIAQAVGGKDEALARRIVGTSTLFFVVLSGLVGLVGWLATPAIMTAMEAPADVREQAIAYLRVIFLAMPLMYFFSFLMMAQRGTGDSRTPFWFLLVAIVLDIVLNPVLIAGLGPAPQMGVAGSATATLIAQGLTLAAMLVHLRRKGSVLVMRREDWARLKPDLSIIRALVFKGLPMAVQMIVVYGASVIMISMVNRYGSPTSAAYGASIQIWAYVQMPAMALGAAVSSMAAQNVGAGRMDRVNRIALLGSLYAFALTAAPVVAIYAAEPWILRLFLPEASASAAIALRVNAIALWGFIFFGLGFVLLGVARATGAMIAPLVIMVVAFWGLRIPFAGLGQGALGADAIWWSFPLGNIAAYGMALAYFRWGGWRTATLMAPGPKAEAAEA